MTFTAVLGAFIFVTVFCAFYLSVMRVTNWQKINYNAGPIYNWSPPYTWPNPFESRHSTAQFVLVRQTTTVCRHTL